MERKNLIILIIALVVILSLGFMAYKYASGFGAKVENLKGRAQIQNNSSNNSSANNQQAQVEVGGVQAQGEGGFGTLSVCVDKCGDGICQKTDSTCGKDNNLNCICPETHQGCPHDCK